MPTTYALLSTQGESFNFNSSFERLSPQPKSSPNRRSQVFKNQHLKFQKNLKQYISCGRIGKTLNINGIGNFTSDPYYVCPQGCTESKSDVFGAKTPENKLVFARESSVCKAAIARQEMTTFVNFNPTTSMDLLDYASYIFIS